MPRKSEREITSLLVSVEVYGRPRSECAYEGCTYKSTDKWCQIHRSINLRLYIANARRKWRD